MVKDIPAASASLTARKSCGLIMPISSIDNCSADHWAEVKSIVVDVCDKVKDPELNTFLVSDADDVGVIQKRIVQNLYKCELVICDVSAKNPNVMFELGLRLAFDKPTIIIKDDKTDYSFDTGVIEHVVYPRDLRFTKIMLFKEVLSAKINAGLRASADDPSHSTFLKNFGQFQTPVLNEKSVPLDEYIIERLSQFGRELAAMRSEMSSGHRTAIRRPPNRDLRTLIGKVISDFIVSEPKSEGVQKALSMDDEFLNFVSSRIDAPDHFESPKEYRTYLKSLAEDLVKSGGFI